MTNFYAKYFLKLIHFPYFKSDPSTELISIIVLWFSCCIVNSLKKYLFLLMETICSYLISVVLYSLTLMETKGKCQVCPSGMQFPYYNITLVGKSEITLHSCIALNRCKGYTIVGSKNFQVKFILILTSMRWW